MKAKRIFLSLFLIFTLVFTLMTASCSKKKEEAFHKDSVLIKNKYQLYKESKDMVTPTGVNIKIDGNAYLKDQVMDLTTCEEIKLDSTSLNPTTELGLKELKKLVGYFQDINDSTYTNDEYTYIYEALFGISHTVSVSNEKEDVIADMIIQMRNLLDNHSSENDVCVVQLDQGELSWKVNVEKAGFYNILVRYFTITGYSSSIERKLKINGEIPFEDAESFTFSRIWKDAKTSFDKDGNFKTDTNKNDLKPQQIELFTFRETLLRDDMGYVTEPYMFYLEEGENTISLVSIKEPFIVDRIEVQSVNSIEDYQSYSNKMKNLHPNVDTEGKSVYLNAEKASFKSSPTLYPITDRSSSKTYPFSLKESKMNIIGGDQWKVLGDWISWDFTVPEDGFYNISMRARQNLIRGMFSSRIAYISENNGPAKVLFNELNDVQFAFSSNWQNVTLGNEDTNYEFYFEKGKTYTFTLEVTLGAYAPLIERIQQTIDELSKTYRMIVAYTTTSPDKNRDYELDGNDSNKTYKFPDLLETLQEYRDELKDISNSIAEISGGGSDKTGVIDAMVVQLETFISKPRSITQKLNSFSNNISSLGSLLTELRELPLAIDYIEIHTPDVKLSKPNESIFKKAWNSVCSFFLSFFIDYSTIGETVESDNLEVSDSIEVWMTLGRDQANVIRNLIDTDFTKHTGIKVNLKLTGADVLLKATLAGIGPDVALNVDSSLPVNYALRNAVYDLTNFDDFFDSVYIMPDGSYSETNRTPWDQSKENVYHASSIRQFQFYSVTNSDIEKANNGNKEAIAKVNAYNAIEEYCLNNNISKEELFDSKTYTKEELQKNIKGIYALPEKQIFMVMFIRDDIFEENGWTELFFKDEKTGLINDECVTWDRVIDLVAKLQTQQLQFYLPVNDAGANALNPVFVSMLYQNGGNLYANDNKETGLMSDAAMRSFEYWTNFYTLYSFPRAASFVNRFRSGEMPAGIAYYETYNTLSVFAPELKGKWSFHLIPGTMDEETGVINHTSTASGTGAVIMKQNEKLSQEKKNSKYNASWEFLKWWTGAQTQAQFGREMEGILGSAARHATANVKAFQELAWPQEDLNRLMKQWDQVHEMPQVAGSYIIGREIENAYRKVINKNENARETLYEYCGNINDEINRKRKEFDLPTLN